MSFHDRFLELSGDIERRFPVAGWRADDAHLWPLARSALYLDMYWNHANAPRPPPRALPLRLAGALFMPLRNRWWTRGHRGVLADSRAAHAVFLGDGVSLDKIDGCWRDRFCEPLIAALHARHRDSQLMQGGTPRRQPWFRAAYPANLPGARGALRALARSPLPLNLSGLEEVRALLASAGERSPSLERGALEHRARTLLATADEFARLLARIAPRIAFVVNYYSGLGPAFVLACRRRGVMSVDLQHCPQEGTHMAYSGFALPAAGYSLLPAIFWNWTREEAEHIDAWTHNSARHCHRSFVGGYPQLSPFLDDTHPVTRAWDQRFHAIGAGTRFEREILVALQTLGGERERWHALRDAICNAPASWRWWIRRHPAATSRQDEEYRALLELHGPNVVHGEAAMPLPALLRHMSALVSIGSGAAREAAFFGVPALFLDEQAQRRFPRLFERGQARTVRVGELEAAIAAATPVPPRPDASVSADLREALARLETIAAEYGAQNLPASEIHQMRLAQ